MVDPEHRDVQLLQHADPVDGLQRHGGARGGGETESRIDDTHGDFLSTRFVQGRDDGLARALPVGDGIGQ